MRSRAPKPEREPDCQAVPKEQIPAWATRDDAEQGEWLISREVHEQTTYEMQRAGTKMFYTRKRILNATTGKVSRAVVVTAVHSDGECETRQVNLPQLIR